MVCAVGLFGFQSVSRIMANSDSGVKVLEIYVADQLYERVTIPDEQYTQTISVVTERGMNTVRIKNGSVTMIDSDCHDHLCELSGPISMLEQPPIVCLPNRVFCTLVSE
ncbi:NusG domain II-containing protein [Paenibacillus albiflavus]|uniref:NusG domain II-containing protein n=1 Tax=Paenibacillus albiflavus TaxID=2545760 RepID=UPI0014050AE9|nr:NusG domain II-containing protein [Paenibacillus albiflavus]